MAAGQSTVTEIAEWAADLPDVALARLGAAGFASSAQVQERLTKQVAGWLTEHLRPKGVGVVIEAEHLCMRLRRVKAVGRLLGDHSVAVTLWRGSRIALTRYGEVFKDLGNILFPV